MCASRWLSLATLVHLHFFALCTDPPERKMPNLRSKRQQFSRYICGIPPYIFYSDIPCNIYAICANHGFATNVPCGITADCIYRGNPNTECVQGICCTLPVILTPTTMSPTTAAKKSGVAQDGVPRNVITFLVILVATILPKIVNR